MGYNMCFAYPRKCVRGGSAFDHSVVLPKYSRNDRSYHRICGGRNSPADRLFTYLITNGRHYGKFISMIVRYIQTVAASEKSRDNRNKTQVSSTASPFERLPAVLASFDAREQFFSVYELLSLRYSMKHCEIRRK